MEGGIYYLGRCPKDITEPTYASSSKNNIIYFQHQSLETEDNSGESPRSLKSLKADMRQWA